MPLQGTVAQINISRGGIPKLPIPEALATPQGLVGDACRNLKYHGGPKQAILLLCAEAIDDLIAQGFPLFFGALGENLTLRSIDRQQFRIGQRWRIGSECWIETTKIRVPCATLNVYGEGAIQKAVYDKRVKAGDFTSPLWAKAGIYASILTPGTIRVGDPVTLVDQLA